MGSARAGDRTTEVAMNTGMDLTDTTTKEIERVRESQTVKASAEQWLHLLMMLGLCQYLPHFHCPNRCELTGPRGCVLVMRYRSR